jgi:hypothetical protein
MKCQEFESIIICLARGQMVETAARETALVHLERCARCANSFEEQQALTAGIRVAAESLVNQGASAGVEEALRQAFREQARQFNVPEIKLRRSRWTVGLAAAAILLGAFLIGVTWLKSPSKKQKQEARDLPATPYFVDHAPKQESPAQIGGEGTQGRKTASVSAGSRRPSVRRAVRQGAAPDATETEVATSFYSLVEEGELVPLESGRVVRVEVPASALIALGLPITAESKDRPVQADLLLGQDGLARAIRFLP